MQVLYEKQSRTEKLRWFVTRLPSKMDQNDSRPVVSIYFDNPKGTPYQSRKLAYHANDAKNKKAE